MFPEEIAAITKILQGCESPVVVELGAQNGEDTEWMCAAIADKILSRRCNFISVEADPANCVKFAERQLPCSLLPCAIADHDGETYFWENHDQGWGFGSIYEPIPGENSVNYDFFKKIGPIRCMTFDTLYHSLKLDRIDLLCVDIHGAEKDMIQHGQTALSRTRHLFMEFFTTPAYKGMATKNELLAMLPGWRVVKEFPWNILLENTAAK